jgi:hypothetical protein
MSPLDDLLILIVSIGIVAVVLVCLRFAPPPRSW